MWLFFFKFNGNQRSSAWFRYFFFFVLNKFIATNIVHFIFIDDVFEIRYCYNIYEVPTIPFIIHTIVHRNV